MNKVMTTNWMIEFEEGPTANWEVFNAQNYDNTVEYFETYEDAKEYLDEKVEEERENEYGSTYRRNP